MKSRSIAVGLGCALLSAAAFAGVGVWSGQGPYGGYVFDILQDPSSATTLYLSTRSGIYKSTDSGSTWSPAMNGIVGSVSYGYPLALDADATSTLYAADSTGHLYRTTDGAANWVQTGYSLPLLPNGSTQIDQITDAPGSTTRVYIATYTLGILVSNDSGATFTPINGSGGSALPAGIPFQTIAVDPANPSHLLAGTAYFDVPGGPDVSSLYYSADAGATWSGVLISYPGSGDSVYSSVTEISFGHGSEVYALADQGIYKSSNGGSVWADTGTLTANVQGYVTTIKGDTTTANSVFAGGYFGLVHSADAGVSFAVLANQTNGVSPNGVDVATVSRLARAGSTWWLATQEAGLFRSTNSGGTWASTNAGIEATNIRAVGMVPITGLAPRILAGYGDAFRPSPGIYAGTDAGDGAVTWGNSNNGLRAYQIRAITADPTTALGNPATTVVYAGGRSEQNGAFAPRNGGIYKSADGGTSWTTIDNGLPPRQNTTTPFLGTVRSIVLDPHSCTGYPACTSALNTVYMSSNGCFVFTGLSAVPGGNPANIGKCGSALDPRFTGSFQFRIAKSGNGGGNWSSSDTGIPQTFPGTQAKQYLDSESLLVVPLVIDPGNPAVLYAGTSDTFDPTQVTTPTLSTGIFKSTDSGATWTSISTGLPTYPGSPTVLGVLSMAIDPSNTQTLWASVIDINSNGGAPGHIYKTVDGGAHWADSSTGMTSADIRALLVDPVTPNVLYAAGGGTSGNPGGVFKSYDSGATWHSISIGLPADAALALSFDPGNHDKLYAGTSSGVWEMTQALDSDFDGVSDAQEDLGPNNGDSNLDATKDKFQADVTYVPPHLSASAPAPLSPLVQNVSDNDFAVQVQKQGSTCAQTQDVQSKPADANGPDPIASNLDYAYGVDLVQFEILNCAATTVKVTYPNFTFGPGWTFRFYGPLTPGDDGSIKWYDFSNHAVQLDAHSWQLTLTRGAFGSYRPAVTGAILFKGGPGYSDRVFGNGFN